MTSSRNLAVLIVDDDALFRELFGRVIAKRFPEARIAEAADIGLARAQIRRNRPDVAFIDVCLPDGSGLDLVKELRREGSSATIAVCTSYDIPEYREAAERSGATCFLAKDGLKADDIARVVARVARAEGQPAQGKGEGPAKDQFAETDPGGPG